MKLRIHKIFDIEGLTDNEKLFVWALGKIMERYGWEDLYTLDGFDVKILLHSDPRAHLKPGAISERIKSIFRIGYLSERRVSIELQKEKKDRLRTYHTYRGEIKCGVTEVEVTDTKVIQVYSYLLGILGFMPEWTYESSSAAGFSDVDRATDHMSTTEQMRAGRITDPFELQQLLNALD